MRQTRRAAPPPVAYTIARPFGDTPMTLTRYALAALLGTALVAAPAAAQATAEDLKKAVDKLDQAAKDLKDAKDAKDDLRTKVNAIDSKIDIIDKDIQELKKDIREIKRRIGTEGSTSLRPDTESAIARGTGRVRFINEFNEEMSVVVNGRSFRLYPGQERLVPVTAGSYTYQVLQLQRFPQERRIAADETKTVRIYPLP
jgi:prefoldin subunit 5